LLICHKTARFRAHPMVMGKELGLSAGVFLSLELGRLMSDCSIKVVLLPRDSKGLSQMAKKVARPVTLMLFGALMLGACSSDGILGSAGPTTTAALPEKPAVDPACASLAARIDDLRKEGSADRVAQAAVGKGETVKVKRASLAKVDELNKINSEFQAKCSNYRPTTAGLAPAAPVQTAAATKVASKTVAAKPKATEAAKPAAQKEEN
jgi:hypothetical protein